MNNDTSQRYLSGLRAELARAGKSQKDLALLLNLSTAAVNRRMLGSVSFRLDELRTIASELNISIDSLIADSPKQVAS